MKHRKKTESRAFLKGRKEKKKRPKMWLTPENCVRVIRVIFCSFYLSTIVVDNFSTKFMPVDKLR
jgi:hypothetical protein